MGNITSGFAGMGFGLSLIIAIGPQNIFILKQGLARKHVGAVVLICIVSDAILIAVGAGGMGTALRTYPDLIDIIRYAGAIFIVSYGTMALLRAIKPPKKSIIEASTDQPLIKAMVTCLAFTWLNPHVYLDTAILLGSVANAPGRNTLTFAIGAIVASSIWFSSLGYGARFLTPLFLKPIASRVLDVLVAFLMFAVGFALILG